MAKKSKKEFVLTARRQNPRPLDKGREKAAKRVWTAFLEANSSGLPTMFVAGLVKSNRHIGSLSELFAELEVLDEWNFGPSEGVTYLSQGLQQLVVLRFLDQFVERGGWYTASYYSDNFGIPPGRLRQAVKRRKLASRKVGRATEYPFEGVRYLWKHDVTFVPEMHPPSLNK